MNEALILCWSFTSKHHRQLQVKDSPKVPTWQMAARAGFEPVTLRMKGVESINAPPRPTNIQSTLPDMFYLVNINDKCIIMLKFTNISQCYLIDINQYYYIFCIP